MEDMQKNTEIQQDDINSQQQGNSNTQQGAEQDSVKEVKTFTQEEVDRIVEKRLARERKKFEDQLKELTGSPMERELSKREREVTKRELMADAREILIEQEQPLEILSLLDYTDKESMEESLNGAITVIREVTAKMINDRLRGKGIPKAGTGNIVDNAIRKAFGLN